MKNAYYTKMWDRLYKPVTRLYPLDVSGAENVPDESVLLCANHSAWIDPVLVVASLPNTYDLRIMGKKELFKLPLLRRFLTKMGVFPVDRGHSDLQAVKTAIGSLKDGWSLLIFPEGTRVHHPGDVSPKGGAAMMAIRSGVKMLPVFIGTGKRLFRRTSVIFGEPYTPVYSGRKGTAEEYQANADEIMRRVYELGGVK
ncbi:MAG: 1-acyl-sn-glycerol-3-phosphate acyltransferase [Oscillospiraceae bacterium]|nr:1-acyl-sn-glycerol-3-phosphate acyltransferase [Oscillospiraceae bacterium]